jgi:signal transduction histidine kinase
MEGLLGTAHLVLFGLTAAVCVVGAVRARRLVGPVGGSLAAFLVLTGAWAAVELVRLAVPSVGAKVVLYTVTLVVGLWSVYVWLWFCTDYADVDVGPAVPLAGALVFAAVSVVKLTNPLHGWYFDARIAGEPFRHLAVEPSALHWVVTAGAYVGTLAGFVLVSRALAAAGRDTRHLTLLVVLSVAPVVPSFVALRWPTVLPSVFYEPVGAAVFAVGALAAVEEEFGTVAAPARHQLAEGLPSPVLVVDDHDRVVDHNDAAAAVFPSLATGRRLDEVVPADETSAGVLTLPTPTGSRHFVSRSTPVEVAGRTVGRTLLLTDVTELEAARRELDRQNDQLDEFAAAVTHELRNPLNVALGHAARARAGCADEEVRAALDAVRSANERMVGIVDDLQTMTRFGKSVPERTEQSLADLVETAWETVDAPTADLSVRTDDTVAADRPRFREMCRRTFAFCLDRGASSVAVVSTPSGFRVEADAPPVDPAVAERLFAYGEQTDAADPMGLALVETLAAAQGWTVRIDPDAPTLRLEFDAAAPVAPAPDASGSRL